MKIKFVVIAISLAFQIFAQTNSTPENGIKIAEALEAYQSENFTERVFLHNDKSKLIRGETLWYSAYLVQGPRHFFSLQSKVLHVDLINAYNEIIVSKTHYVENGIGSGAITFPTSAPPGDYVIRAYTNWMRNFDDQYFFSKKIEVVVTSNEYPLTNETEVMSVSFFPEGGQLINDLRGRVAFKAVGVDGKGIAKELKGEIIDSEGKKVAFFETLYKGMGSFYFKPQKGKVYKAVFSDGSDFTLPQAVDQGTGLIAYNDPDRIALIIRSSDDYIGKEMHLIGTQENHIIFNHKYTSDTGRVELALPKVDLPKGILTLTLFDDTKTPRATRQLFIQNKQSLYISTTVKGAIEEEGKMHMEVRVVDEEGNPVSTNLSLAITDANFMDKATDDKNLATNLLIESASLDPVESSASFVLKDDEESVLRSDLLMMTHSFKSVDWKEVLNPTNNSKEFEIVKGLTISGTAWWEDGRPIKSKELEVMAFARGITSQFSIPTDENGRFSIEGFNGEGTVNLIFRIHNKKGKLLASKVILDEQEKDLPIPDYEFQEKVNIQADGVSETTNQALLEERISYAMFDQDATILDEVRILGEKIDENSAPSLNGIKPSAVRYIDQDKVDRRDYLEVLNTVSGVRYQAGGGASGRVSILGSERDPTWVLDGSIIEQDVAGLIGGFPTNIPWAIRTLNPSDVERIEVLMGADAVAYGVRGGEGVIIIYTNRGKSSAKSKTTNLEVRGHSEPQFFDPSDSQNTNRYTLYWNSNVQTDENGVANIFFYNSSNTEDIQVDIQGLSSQGLLGVYLETFDVEKITSMDSEN